MANREALRRARELREEFRDTAQVFTQEAFIDALRDRLSDLAEEAFDDLVENVAQRVDDDATRERHDEDQQPLLPGFDLGGEYRLGGGRRVAKRHAHINHAYESLALAQANATAIMTALQQRFEEIQRLAPYWPPGVMKEQAVVAYRDANPGAAAS